MVRYKPEENNQNAASCAATEGKNVVSEVFNNSLVSLFSRSMACQNSIH